MTKKAILVTGGAGYIGSHTVYRLLEAGYTPIVLDNFSTGFRRLVAADAILVEGDAGDGDILARIFDRYRPAAVIHFAASISVSDSLTRPLDYYANNVAVSLALIRSCLEHGVQSFVFSSTAAVYGIPDDACIGEDGPISPITPYGRSKHMVETMLADAAAAGDLRYCALRYFNAAGADATLRSGQIARNASHLIKVACETAVGIRPYLDIYGTDYKTDDGTCVRDYIHVSDLAEAHLCATRYLLDGGTARVLNCGCGKGYSVREIVHLVMDISGVAMDVRQAPPRSGDPPCLVADNRAIGRLLRWQPKLSIKDMIASALAWEKQLAKDGINGSDNPSD